MAPQSTSTATLIQNQLTAGKQELDCNHNDVSERVRHPAGISSTVKRPRNSGDMNERSRKLIRNCFSHLNTNLNVLVIGARGAGKSSLINSMNMSLTQEWKDRARYCPGRNHLLDECVMYHNKKAGGKVVFWDAMGFENINDEDHAVLILRYILEGRIPAKCIPCVLLMSKETIKKRYHRIVEANRRIDLVLYVSALNEEPQTSFMSNIARAINTSKHASVNRIPIVSVATKTDLIEDKLPLHDRLHEYSLENLITTQSFQQRPRRRRLPPVPEVVASTKLVDNYKCELEPWSDESANPSSMCSSPERDSQLLAVWREIISRTATCSGGDRRKRAYSAGAQSRPMCRCLPFRLDYMRLRSASF
uniref:Uncharacterized protein LOC100175113 n=1 Tax=Phallusia mammillata TaxID=59560 RepID=A0A6F9DGP7_9ASCI|nr:uncharacterized protein LOC100175113 [Phallusia mammillata]